MSINKNLDMYLNTGRIEYIADAVIEFKARYPTEYEKWYRELIRKIKQKTKLKEV